MGLQKIRDGLAYTLNIFGPYDAAEISACSTEVLETTSACAIVFSPGRRTTIEPLTMGASGNDQVFWSIEGVIYIKYINDVKLFKKLVWQAHDDFRATIRKDRSLNKSTPYARVTDMSYDDFVSIEAPGGYWGMVEWNIIAEDYELD